MVGISDALPVVTAATPMPRRGWVILAAIGVAAGVAGVFLATRPAPSDAGAGERVDRPPPATSVSAAPPSATITVTVAPAESVMPTESAAPVVSAPSNKPVARSKPPEAHPRPDPARGCDPPFEIDANGHRRMKPQCL